MDSNTSQRQPILRRVIRLMRGRPALAEVIIVPCIFYVMDLILRVFLEMDIADAGADMSLLAMSAMAASLTIELEQGDSDDARIALAAFMIFLFLWIVCLGIISDVGSSRIGLSQLPVARTVSASGIGIFSFILSSYVAVELGV